MSSHRKTQPYRSGVTDWSPTLRSLGEHQEWLQRFIDTNGRAPRVLHIGNIANNAYHNAKLMNRAGLDCDVICDDYYHVMACPEWEEADFDGDIRDQFRPNWAQLDLRGFHRPAWFVQGPVELCLRYLLARRQEQGELSQQLWEELQVCAHASSDGRSSGDVGGTPRLMRAVKRLVTVCRPSRLGRTGINALLALEETLSASRDHDAVFARSCGAVLSGLRSCLGLDKARLMLMLLRRWRDRGVSRRTSALIDEFQKAFPNRSDQCSLKDLARYGGRRVLPLWEQLFNHYDIVQGYGTHPIWPMIAGVPYFAFEHGTLREIPLERSTRGRLTALAYHLAEHVFVTNADCLENARWLAGDRVTFLNHPYDEDQGAENEDWKHLRQELRRRLGADFLLFFPTRHDWVKGTGYADKGNDIFIRAFEKLRNQVLEVGLVCCTWGRNVEDSRRLIDSLGVAQYVLWVQPMGMRRFIRNVRAADVVADQFTLGSFGGVTFKALAGGAPVCTFLDRENLQERYPVPPPVINCRTEEEVVKNLTDYLSHPQKLLALGREARDWVKRYHSGEEVVAKQLRVYRQRLDSPPGRRRGFTKEG